MATLLSNALHSSATAGFCDRGAFVQTVNSDTGVETPVGKAASAIKRQLIARGESLSRGRSYHTGDYGDFCIAGETL